MMLGDSPFRDPATASGLVHSIKKLAADIPGDSQIRFMEVCGGHTMAIFKHGIQGLLPRRVELVSGPGCPVCVTHNEFIDYAVALAQKPEVILATFGDLVRVPGSTTSLLKAKSAGADVRICYSPLDALELARSNPKRMVVFPGIGFETTAPGIAAVIKRAAKEGLSNFTVLSALKTMPNAMRALVSSGELKLNGFICPGHVTAVTGDGIYDFLSHEFRTPCVVSGFEPLDLLQTIQMLLTQIKEERSETENQYLRTASRKGNSVARAVMNEVFEESDESWRGLGVIPGSGLRIRESLAAFDARKQMAVTLAPVRENKACICGAIMRGVKRPADCPLFSKACTPEDPKGSCMVSDEGTCATWFKYGRNALEANL